MKKILTTAAALIVMLAATQAMAVSAGKSVEWDTSMGKVVFKGDDHAGKFCGECHDGKKAFKSAGNCAKCHKK